MAVDSVPGRYLDAWARLQCQKPMRVSGADWRQAIDDAGRFLDAWGALAIEFDWTPGDLFDVPRPGHVGLVWWLAGETVHSLGGDCAITAGGRKFDRAGKQESKTPSGRIGPDDGANWKPDPDRDGYPLIFLEKVDGRWRLSEYGAGMDLQKLLKAAELEET